MNKIFYTLTGIALCLMAAPGISSAQSSGNSFRDRYYREGSYFFDDITKIRLPELFTIYKAEFGLGQDDDMVQTNNVVTDQGQFTTKYEHYHKGIPVEGSMINVIGSKGIAQYANGFLVTELNIDNSNIIPVQQAIDAAIQYVGATTYLWQDPLLEDELKAESGDPDATNFPKTADLIITKKRGEQYTADARNYQLCYRVVIHALNPSSVTDVYVDANTGALYTSQNALEHDYTATGTQWTWYNGWHNNIKTRSCGSCFNFWLHDVDRNIFTTKYGVNPWNKGSYNKDNNNNWVENDTKTASSAHWALERAWEYYINRHGRWGTNYGGKRVHVQTAASGILGTSANAGYLDANGNDNIYLSNDGSYPGSGSAGGAGYSMAALDIMGHEYNHGMIKASSALGSLGDLEAKALNEGYSDIFGNRIERYTLGTTDWSIGEATGWLVRYLDNPHNDIPTPSPARYLEPGYWNASAYHNAGGVIRKWFYLLANGGTFGGQTVSAVGLETADDIAYITYNWWLWSNVKYLEAANQTVHATVAHWGRCSQQHKQVVKAFRAVGLNVPIPLCFKIDIDGPVILQPSESAVFKVRLNEISDPNGQYSWDIPSSWNAVAQGNTLTLNSANSIESREISAKYTAADGTVSKASMVVHFSDVPWQPTNNMPVSPVSGQLELLPEQIDAINIYPNPATNTVTISIKGFTDKANLEIYDLAGRIIKSEILSVEKTNIDISGITEGIYLIKLNINGHMQTKKLSIIR
ncbi:hypothetical protein DBR32_14985 [Taibaiella sp. KBW10]|uniref:T9SS type A sorting domain-containing protein n=1 Tax=Taibaiella sp. KBW10 TaxID=2153357 RepID=UPI000F5B69D6|nr:M4 family metallopeptidase [Taibaiella sp. KBW10]RQO29879.1 hypothetical protein DBR32_14985 [Taibaiella sp. KBW10]